MNLEELHSYLDICNFQGVFNDHMVDLCQSGPKTTLNSQLHRFNHVIKANITLELFFSPYYHHLFTSNRGHLESTKAYCVSGCDVI